MTPTLIGLYLLFFYPLAVLIYDAFLKFVLGDETISEYVWTHTKLRVAVCIYLILWCAVLVAHLGFFFLPG